MESDQAHNSDSNGRAEVSGPTGQGPPVDFPTPQPQSSRRSKLALASPMLVLGAPLVFICLSYTEIAILGIFILVGIMTITGVCLGIAALWQIKRSKKRLRGVVSAIGGIVASCGALVLLLLMWQSFGESHDKAHSWLYPRQLQLAVLRYSEEHNG